MQQLNYLFAPIKIGRLSLKNRIVMAPMGMGYTPDGFINDRLTAFYVARAKGGVGLIICNVSSTIVEGKTRGVGIHSDEFIPGLKKLTKAIHAGGARVAAQIAARAVLNGELVGPSDFSPPRGGRPGPKRRPLTVDEIEQIIDSKGDEVRRARKAGFDAVEFHANIGECLPSYFISAATNHRTDRYGGSLENRFRFLIEMAENGHKKAGKHYPIMCRLSGADFLEGGNTIEDTKKAAPMLEKAGFAAIDIVTGWTEAPVPFVQRSVPPAAFIYLAEEVKKAVKIPVIGGTKMIDPVLANQLIADGRIDLAFMGRPLLADPELPVKAKQGRLDEIRTCLVCNHCMSSLRGERGVTCPINPQLGKEEEWALTQATMSKKVLVIGGGPAGMEAATVAAQRGHKVALWEKTDKLGGNLNLAAIPPFKQDVRHLTRYLARQMELAKVEVKLNQEAKPESVAENKADAVIVATGASAQLPDIRGAKGSNVVTATEILTGTEDAGENVVIIGGGMIGCEVAEFLTEKGRKVTILEMLERVGEDIEASYRWVVMMRMKQNGIRMEAGMKAEAINNQGVIANRAGASELFPADTVVLAVGFKSNNELYDQLKGKIANLYPIGDCTEPHRIFEAIDAGFQLAREI